MFNIKFNVRREISILVLLGLVLAFIAFSERRHDNTVVRDVQVKIRNTEENHFMDESEVMDLMQINHENMKGASVQAIDMKGLEKKIKKNQYVFDADVFSDLKGNIVVNVDLHRPIARIIRPDGPDGYIAEDGNLMPTSEKFSSRVVLVSGGMVPFLLQNKNLYQTEEGKDIMNMIQVLLVDDFWRAQIAQIDIDRSGRVHLYPQIGGQVIEFGTTENVDEKFRKLKVFYKSILPQRGWNRYHRVNVEYAGQVVAE